MRDSSTSWFPDDRKATNGLSRKHGQASSNGPMRLLRGLVGMGRRNGHAGRERTSAEVTTQLQASRGQALREAHRTLRLHMKRHPALRKVTPHLWALERALGKHGSRALSKLPLGVLQRGLAQLALLQRDDESPEDAAQLRVLRLRVIEAIQLRGQHLNGQSAAGAPHDLQDPQQRLAGLDVQHVSVDEYNRVVKHAVAPQLKRLSADMQH